MSVHWFGTQVVLLLMTCSCGVNSTVMPLGVLTTSIELSELSPPGSSSSITLKQLRLHSLHRSWSSGTRDCEVEPSDEPWAAFSRLSLTSTSNSATEVHPLHRPSRQ